MVDNNIEENRELLHDNYEDEELSEKRSEDELKKFKNNMLAGYRKGEIASLLKEFNLLTPLTGNLLPLSDTSNKLFKDQIKFLTKLLKHKRQAIENLLDSNNCYDREIAINFLIYIGKEKELELVLQRLLKETNEDLINSTKVKLCSANLINIEFVIKKELTNLIAVSAPNDKMELLITICSHIKHPGFIEDILRELIINRVTSSENKNIPHYFFPLVAVVLMLSFAVVCYFTSIWVALVSLIFVVIVGLFVLITQNKLSEKNFKELLSSTIHWGKSISKKAK